MKTIEHSIDIAATPEQVWTVLAATEEYGAWNPFMPSLAGAFLPGERLTVTIRPRKRAMTFRPTVVAVEPGRLVRWQGKLGVRGIFDGEHELIVEAGADGARFTQRECFSGVLIPFMQGTLRDTLEGFTAMNEALRARVLTVAKPPTPA